MKKLFVKAIEWMMAAFRNTQSVYGNVNDNVDSSKLKSDEVKVNEETLNPKPSTLNQAKLRFTIPEIEQLLRAKYDLRYNVLTEQSEYRVKGSGVAFEPVTQRVYKTWMADLQADGHNVWWIEGVRIAAESMHIEAYHPVRNYFTSLPEWDGADRLRPLMLRLTDDEVMVGYLCRWMLAFVAQAQGREEALYANSVAPILISEQQGWHKSTFCRMLMPRELRMFYTDCFDLTAESQC